MIRQRVHLGRMLQDTSQKGERIMKKKHLAVFMVAAVAALALIGCQSKGENESTAAESISQETSADAAEENTDGLPGSGKTIAFVPKQLGNPYFVAIRDAIEDEAVKNGFEFKCNAPDATTEVDKQVSICEAFVAEGVDVLIIAPNDATAIVDVINEAQEKGIAVFLVDSGADESGYVSLISTDNYAGGELAAQWMGENVKGKVAIIDGMAGNEATTQRYNGFMEKIKEYPDIEVVTSDYGNGDMATAMTVAENFLTAYTDLAGIFCCDDIMAQGAGQAVAASGKSEEITICGFDGSPEGSQAILDGLMDATIAQLPATMGRMAVDYAIDYFDGKEVEHSINTDCEIVTAENAEEYLTWH